jgi:anti-sigma B factor antagonist
VAARKARPVWPGRAEAAIVTRVTARLTSRVLPGRVVVRCEGEVDLANADELRAVLAGVLADQPPRVVIDLADLTFLDSTGLGVIARAHLRAVEYGGQLQLTGARGTVARLLEVTRLDRLNEPV